MIKSDEMAAPDSTWNKTEPQEPVFILCARDKTAPAIVRLWCAGAKAIGVNDEKLGEAERLADQMETWQAANGSKVPD